MLELIIFNKCNDDSNDARKSFRYYSHSSSNSAITVFLFSGLYVNRNATVVSEAGRMHREKLKVEHEARAEKIKVDKERQKQKAQERKEKEKKRTQKQEKRR